MDITTLVKPKKLPVLAPGDTVKVSTKIVEAEKERTQAFQGVVIKVKSGGAGPILTVRKVVFGIGVERTFPLYSPRVGKIEIVRRGKTRRARLYYLRKLSARASRIKERRAEAEELVAAEAAAEEAKAAEAKPATAEVKPAAGEVKPVTQEVKPTPKELKPAAQEVKPAAQETKPPAQNVTETKKS